MHKSLIDLKEAIKFKDEQKNGEAEPLDSPEPIAEGEPIAEIKQGRHRKDSLEQQMAELNAQEKELNLRLKILKKKEQIEKVQLRFDQIAEEESFYTERTDTEGYTELREDKWQNDFQALIVKLKNIELDEVNGTVDLLTSQEAKANVNKQIKVLIAIKKKCKSKNTMNKLKRGFQKTMKGIGNLSKEVGKISDGMGSFSGGSGKRDSTDWEGFFSDKPKRTKSTKTTKKRKSRKTKKKGKKSKTTKKRKKSKTTKKAKTQKKSSDNFGGFSF